LTTVAGYVPKWFSVLKQELAVLLTFKNNTGLLAVFFEKKDKTV